MIRGLVIIALVARFGAMALGNAFVVTNRVDDLVGTTNSVDRQAAVRMVIHARLGEWNLPLVLSGHTILWEWRDPRVEGLLVHSWPGLVLDATAGRVAVTASLDVVEPGTYDTEVWALLNGNRSHRLAADTFYVTNGISLGGAGDVTVNIISTSNVSVIEVGSGTVYTQMTSSGSAITAYRGSVGGGEGIAAYTNGVFAGSITSLNINASLYSRITGGELEIGAFSLAFPGQIGTNRVWFNYTGASNTWQVPSGISNVAFWVWGGAGGGVGTGSAGGFTLVSLAVLPLEFFHLVVGQGGQSVTGGVSGYAQTDMAWPGGGRGFSVSANIAGGGGAYSAVWRASDDSVVAVAGGGGGGGGSVAVSGGGGGVSGGDGVGTGPTGIGGGGGSQSAGGTTASPFINMYFTNTPGMAWVGGDAGVTNGLSLGNQRGGGGGSGYPYGGGGAQVRALGQNASGGGGAGYITTSSVYAVSYRGVGTTPVGQEIPEYVAGVAVPQGATHLSRSGNGMIVVGY